MRAGGMQSDEIRTVLHLTAAPERRVVGQPHAVEAGAQAICTHRAKLTEPRRPFRVFRMGCTGGGFFFQAEDGIRDLYVTGVQTCALPISRCTSALRQGTATTRSSAAPPFRSRVTMQERWRR